MQTAPRSPSNEWPRAVLRSAVFALLLLSPLPFGSVEPWAVSSIEVAASLLGVLVVVLVARDPSLLSRKARLLLAPAAVLLLVGISQLVPVGESTSSIVPEPTRKVRHAVEGVLPETHVAAAAATLARSDTLDALLRLLAYAFVAAAASVAVRTPAERRQAAVVIGGSAAFQAIYGVAEYLSGHQHIFGYAKKYYLSEATGTFINRNHFAGYLAMAIPVTMGFAISAGRRALPKAGLTSWLVSLGRREHASRVVAGACLVLLWAGILLSYSRGGLAVALAGAVLVTYWAGRRRRGTWLLLATLALPLFALLWQDVRPPGHRLTELGSEVIATGGRVAVWRATLRLVPEYAVLGAGYGTFEEVFASRQPPEIALRYDHAHNDWLECLLEGGAAAVAAFLAVFVLVVTPRGTKKVRSGSILARAPVAGVVVIALHSLVDFGLRIPAVAVLAAVLVGLAAGSEDEDPAGPVYFADHLPASRT